MKVVDIFENTQSTTQQIDAMIQQTGLWIDASELVSFYRRCSDSIDSAIEDFASRDPDGKTVMFRAMSSDTSGTGIRKFTPAAHYKANPRTRSLSGDNFLLNMISSGAIPGWDKLPRRMFSTFLTNSRLHATFFGSALFVCFPVNGSKIGMTRANVDDFNHKDAWDLKHGTASAKEFANERSFIRSAQRYLSKKVNDQDVQYIRGPVEITWEVLGMYDRLMKKYNIKLQDIIDHYKEVVGGFDVERYADTEHGFREFYSDLLDAKRHKFEAITTSELKKVRGTYREFWTENTVYYLSLEEAPTVLQLIKQLKEKGLL